MPQVVLEGVQAHPGQDERRRPGDRGTTAGACARGRPPARGSWTPRRLRPFREAACYDPIGEAPARASAPPSSTGTWSARSCRPPAWASCCSRSSCSCDQISNLMKVLVSRGADLATVVRAFVVPAAEHLLGHDPHGLPARGAAGLRPDGQRQRDRGPAGERRQSRSACCGPWSRSRSSPPSSPSTCYAVLGPAANQAYREIIFALIVSKRPQRRAAARLQRRPDSRRDDGALRVRHRGGDGRSGRTSSSTTPGTRSSRR